MNIMKRRSMYIENFSDQDKLLLDYVETSSTAFEELRKAGFSGDIRQAVADVLRSGVIPVPDAFPGSSGCVQYGKAIAEYILRKQK